MPHLLGILAKLPCLSELSVTTEEPVCLMLSCLEHRSRFQSCGESDACFNHPPKHFQHAAVDHYISSYVMQQLDALSAFHTLVIQHYMPSHMQLLPCNVRNLYLMGCQSPYVCQLNSFTRDSWNTFSNQLESLHVDAFLTDELIDSLCRFSFTRLHTFGFHLKYIMDDQMHGPFSRVDQEMHDELVVVGVRVSDEVTKLSSSFCAVEVFEVWGDYAIAWRQQMRHYLDCSWMTQNIFPRSRGVTNKSECLSMDFWQVPETIYIANLGCR